MKKGKRPDSPEVKALRGTSRRDRNRPVKHLSVVPDLPVRRPAGMPAAAEKIWDTYAPLCIESGALTAADAMTFAMWCVLSDWLQRTWRIEEAPPASQVAQWRMLGESFGLCGERSRQGIQAPKPERENEFAMHRRFAMRPNDGDDAA